jgi:hypothetical protein
MEREYRILTRGEDNFAHVRIKKFLFWGRWKKIATYNSGFGMHWLPDFDYPKSKSEAIQIIYDFDMWHKNKHESVNLYTSIVVDERNRSVRH